MLSVASLLIFSLVSCCSTTQVTMKFSQNWNGNFEGKFIVPLKTGIIAWQLNITFDEVVTNLQQWDGYWVFTDPTSALGYKLTDKFNGQGKTFSIVNKNFKGIHKAGSTLEIRIGGKYSGSKAPSATAVFIDLSKKKQTLPSFPSNIPDQKTKYNYCEVLMKSILFYEAQRSGKLPANNRIPWRGDSALGDHGNNGEDLTGGWYDAGDHIKFGLPMAWSTTMLTWSLIRYKDAYEKCGQLQAMLDCIKWPLDYFLKAHVASHELYVQVGNGAKDHGYWGRAEEMTMDRPAYKITESKPGSDVVGETAAAMAAGSIAFRDVNAAYSAKLLSHAKQLYEFADKFRGKYSDSVAEAAGYYRSFGYVDEIAWAGLWLYKATNITSYLKTAEDLHQGGAAWGASWDDDQAPNNVLLWQETQNITYKQDIIDTYVYWMPGGKISYTPKGLAFRLQWGTLRYAANMAAVALIAADNDINPTLYRKWAISQIHYALGDTGRSFVIGFGVNPPTRPHHRSSSCPVMPAPCGWDDLTQKGPNPHILYGALVGGPGINDEYVDNREDYVHNEVACDYNAGFTLAVAAVQHLALNNELPTTT